ncbi:serine/threonine-protein kinase [Nocardia cyriacigeorgica]|uniref:serine/threonine-protein kinase n=1 Tax=Nocardia cyriacigeorgica TaxID=135487 RepID=UPI0024558E87|nr:serine/threonine-protein kinase [Nocardia cyriacigeorgica]
MQPGSVFAGYQIERRLGRGGMGSVYLAKHPRLPRRTALKLLNPDLFDDTESRTRFEREADLAAGLDHPNIVTVFDRGVEDAQLWISMQYIDGVDAASLDPNTLPVPRAVQIIADTAQALDFAHSMGVLHRDVKPANIMLSTAHTGPERVYLTDFGIARLRDDGGHLTQTGSFTATIAYASPEQLTGGPLDHRTDQYSLACSLYWMLTGTAPFNSPHPVAVIQGHLQHSPPPLSSVRHGLPAGVDAVMARALAKRPSERFGSCAEFAEAVRAALSGAGPVSGSHVQVGSMQAPMATAQGQRIVGQRQVQPQGQSQPHWRTVGSGPGVVGTGPDQGVTGLGVGGAGAGGFGTGAGGLGSGGAGSTGFGAGAGGAVHGAGATGFRGGTGAGVGGTGPRAGGFGTGGAGGTGSGAGAAGVGFGAGATGFGAGGAGAGTGPGAFGSDDGMRPALDPRIGGRYAYSPSTGQVSAAAGGMAPMRPVAAVGPRSHRKLIIGLSAAVLAVVAVIVALVVVNKPDDAGVAAAGAISAEFPSMVPGTSPGSGVAGADCTSYDAARDKELWEGQSSTGPDFGAWSAAWGCQGTDGPIETSYYLVEYSTADDARRVLDGLRPIDITHDAKDGLTYPNYHLPQARGHQHTMVTGFPGPDRGTFLLYTSGMHKSPESFMDWWKSLPLA